MAKQTPPVQEQHTHDLDFYSIFERHHTVMLVIESETGAILYGNPAAVKFYGYPLDVLTTMLITDINDLPASEVRRQRMRAEREEQNSFEFRHRLASGEIRTVEVDSSPINVNGRFVLFSLIHDVTERKMAEHALRESEDRYRTLVESSPDGVILHRGGAFLYANTSALAMYQASSLEELQRRSILETVHPDDRHAVAERIRSIEEGRRTPLHELRILKTDGESLYVETIGSPIDFQGDHANQIIIRDVSERKKKEEELHRINRTYRALSRCSRALIHATDEQQLIKDVCRIIIEDCRHSLVWIGYAEEDEEKTVRPVIYHGFEDGYLETLKVTWADTPRGRGPTGTAIRTGEPRICRNLKTDPLFSPWREQAIKRGFASSISLPLKVHEKAFGALTIYSADNDSFTADETALLTELVGDLSYGITAIRLRAAHEKTVQALTLMEERYHSLFNEMTEGFALCEIIRDEKGDPSDYRFLDINPSYEHMIGMVREEIIGTGKKHVLPDDDVHWMRIYGKVATTGRPEQFQYQSFTLKRYYDVLVYRSAPDQIGVMFTDVTAHKLMEDEIRRSRDMLEARVHERTLELKKSEERFRNTLDNLIEGCMILDCAWTYLYVNEAMARQRFRTKDSLLGRSLLDVEPGVHATPMFHHFQLCMENRLPQSFIREQAPLEGAASRWFEFHCVPVPEGIFVLSSDITERQRAEKALRQYNEQLQGLSQRLIEAQEAERRKIAFELHDEIGQVLTAVQLNLHGIMEFEDVKDIPVRLHESVVLTEQLLQQVREMSVDLRPWMLDQLGLAPSLRWYVDKQSQRGKFNAEFSAGNISGRLPAVIEITVYRVIQEALTNILRHAHASNVVVTLKKENDMLVTEIKDDGVGFETKAIHDIPLGRRGLGMVSMEERISSLGGTLTVHSAPGNGTTIRFMLPLRPSITHDNNTDHI